MNFITNGELRIEAERLCDENEHLREENTKLRDFAKSYLTAASVDCGICPYCDPELCDTETNPMSKGCRLWEEMRKLGVEVSE